MSASCFLPGACSPSLSCCIAAPAPPLSSSLSMTISPNVTSPLPLSLSLLPLHSFSFLVMHCRTVRSLLTDTQPPHGPAGSFTHLVVQPVCVSVCTLGVGTDRSKSPLSLSPLPGMREHPPIPVVDLADHIERLKANDGLRFSQEYEVRVGAVSLSPSFSTLCCIRCRAGSAACTSLIT